MYTTGGDRRQRERRLVVVWVFWCSSRSVHGSQGKEGDRTDIDFCGGTGDGEGGWLRAGNGGTEGMDRE